jgi:hypothetical protein
MENLTEQLDFLKFKNKLEFKELLEMMVNNNDFIFEFESGEEYRIISDYKIYDIYCEEQEDSLKECYPEIFDKKPWWVEIDLDKTIDNILNADGYGNLFASYDGEEHEVTLEKELFHFFRTN